MNISFTKAAESKVLEYMSGPEKSEQALRITIPGKGPNGYTYQFFLDDMSQLAETDVVHDTGAFKVVVSQDHIPKLDNATVDWIESVSGSGFKVDSPYKDEVNLDESVEDRIRTALNEDINPALASHGGAVELIEVRGTQAMLRMTGGCQGCASSTATLKHGVEVKLKEVAPEITEIIDVTDHSAGENPYY